MDESITLIDTEALGMTGVVAAYLAVGKEKALIDTGHRSSADAVVRDLEALGIGNDDLDYLLPTHVHLDHCGACGTLARRFQNASVLVHPKGEPHLSNPARLVKGATEVFGHELVKRYGLPEPIHPSRVRHVANDQTIDLGSAVGLRSVWTPGHAPHHLSYFLEGSGVLLTGDAVGVRHPGFPVLVPTTPPPSFDLDQAIESLKRIGELTIKRLCTPHFGVLEGGRDVFQQNVSAMLDWKNELESLVSEGVSVADMVNRLTEDAAQKIGRQIGDVPDYLRVMIRVSVQGFVRYLERGSS